MALQKQNINLPFTGLDLKSDPFKIAPGNFLSLQNTIPLKGNGGGILLQKRNGFAQQSLLPTSNYQYLTTFNGNLTAIGPNVTAYAAANLNWVPKGAITNLQLSTLPLIRSSSNQIQVDTAISSTGILCVVYTDTNPSTTYKYALIDSNTGQNILAPQTIGTLTESPRVFLLQNYFMIIYSQSANLNYIAIPFNNFSFTITTGTLVTNYAAGMSELAYDGVVENNSLLSFL